VRPARVIYHDISQRRLKINGRAIAAPKETPSLAPRALEETKAGAETEAIDAELEGGAAATEEMLEERLQAQGAGDILLDFGEFASSEFFPARAYRRVVAEAAEEELDFGEGEAHVTGKADEQDARERFAVAEPVVWSELQSGVLPGGLPRGRRGDCAVS